jgi:chorismate lyase/3-hydroxybenzoate synthase
MRICLFAPVVGVANAGFRHALRSWNYLDPITEATDDGERYRRFCVGRATGLGEVAVGTLPAATAIGPSRRRCARCRCTGFAARAPGVPVENPRAGQRVSLSAPVRPAAAEFRARHAAPSRTTMRCFSDRERRGP